MSVNDEGGQFPSMTPGETGGEGSDAATGEGGWVTAAMLMEGRIPAARLRAEQPAGAVFALGWVMAELFDPRRRVSAVADQPPFDPDVQLPLVTDLAPDPKLVYFAAELAEYAHWFPHLTRPLRRVTAQANKKRAAVEAENLATVEAAGTAPPEDTAQPDNAAHPDNTPQPDNTAQPDGAGPAQAA